ncbi:hypothetical protein ACGFNQ_21130 [Streptomyces asoensis]|uniref:hypothetical protein n=1 Tax=Streptomyces asoensis TaxID=249586 RepID=UPI00371A18B0
MVVIKAAVGHCPKFGQGKAWLGTSWHLFTARPWNGPSVYSYGEIAVNSEVRLYLPERSLKVMLGCDHTLAALCLVQIILRLSEAWDAEEYTQGCGKREYPVGDHGGRREHQYPQDPKDRRADD